MTSYMEVADADPTSSSHLPYKNQYMKQKLAEKYGDSICFSKGEGSSDIATTRESTADILTKYHNQSAPISDEEEKCRIITTAAKLIKADIKTQTKTNKDFYPAKDDFSLVYAVSFLPDTLNGFLEGLFVGKDNSRNIAGIGQSIMQAVCPRSFLAPLQLGLANQVYHHYRSEFLLDILHSLGFCSSYAEIQRFEGNCAVVNASTYLIGDLNGGHVLMATDNVDFNIRTLDGKNTFHGMGSIAAISPHRTISRPIPRKSVSLTNIIEAASINVDAYYQDKHKLNGIKFAVQSMQTYDEIERLKTDTLWQMAWFLPKQRPNCSGFMHLLHKNKSYPGKSNILFLPMIDLNASDMSCIYSTLNYLLKFARNNNFHPIVTFDQPLFWKASMIIQESQMGSD